MLSYLADPLALPLPPSSVPVQVEATQEMTRIVGLSATLPNFDDVADFLRWERAAPRTIVHAQT